MKKIVTILSLLVFVVSTMASVFAMENTGNYRKGKYKYRGMAKAAFKAGKSESKKPNLDPSSKTRAQWERLFDKKDFSEFSCPEDWKKLDEKDLLNIYAYLYKYAADSPTPAKCK